MHLTVTRGLDAQSLQYPERRPVQDPNQGIGHHVEPVERIGHPERRGQRAFNGDEFGGLLSHHDMEKGHRHDAHRGRKQVTQLGGLNLKPAEHRF